MRARLGQATTELPDCGLQSIQDIPSLRNRCQPQLMPMQYGHPICSGGLRLGLAGPDSAPNVSGVTKLALATAAVRQTVHSFMRGASERAWPLGCDNGEYTIHAPDS
jgi:hypothetical protein